MRPHGNGTTGDIPVRLSPSRDGGKRVLIRPAFAANEGNLIPQVNIGNVQPDDFDLPEALKQKESDNRSQS